MNRLLILSFFVLFALIISGCDKPSVAHVLGKVTYQGKVVTSGEVHFYSKELGLGAVTRLDEQGGFTMKEPLVVGKYGVAVRPTPPTPVAPGSRQVRTAFPVPNRYRDPSTSGIVVTIQPGENDLLIQLAQ